MAMRRELRESLRTMPRMTRLTPMSQVDASHLWFFVFRGVNGEYRWRLYAGNRKMIANSGEGYKRLIDCEHGINLVASSGGGPVHYSTVIRSR